jgi:16S rRNA (uracil1498-N3)-methyltransferase
MKNVPRVFIDSEIQIGKSISIGPELTHYLNRVMRTDTCLIFNQGDEYTAKLSQDLKYLTPESKTGHTDPSNDVTLYFALIKKTDELVAMATQMGVAILQPVITQYTNANHIKWDRAQKIIIESSEQSGRNSVPKLLQPINFADMEKSNLIFADERQAGLADTFPNNEFKSKNLLIGPEGGFSGAEFAVLESAGAKSLSLGKTILRAETAAVVALVKIL